MKNRLIGFKWKVKRFVYKLFKINTEPVLTKNPLLEWPRNFNCVCGSGKKFKKCCLNDLARRVTIEDAIGINLKLEKYRV